MSLTQSALGALVLLPLLVAAVTAVLPHTPRRTLGVGTALVLPVLLAPVLWSTAVDGDVVDLALGGYEPPLGIRLRADGLSAAFLTLSVVVGTAITAYAAVLPHSTGRRIVSPPTMQPEGPAGPGGGAQPEPAEQAAPADRPGVWRPGHPSFWPLWLACWSGLNAVFLSGDLFNTYVGLELVGMTAVALVALGGRSSWQAALRYLFVAVLGSLLLLIGIGLLVSITGTLDVLQAGAVLADAPEETRPAAVLALCLITVGMCLKVALVPFHTWLIPAHAGAPSAVSPLLSALVIKAPVFVLLRVWLWVVPAGEDLAVLTVVLSVMGAAAVVGGSVLALRQTHLKPLIAYSTVAQVGYWFLFAAMVGGSSSGSPEGLPGVDITEDDVVSSALVGTVAMALGHGLAKAAMFLAAGFLKDLYGTDEMDRLRGVGQHHPGLVMAMGLSAVGLAGLPISLSFSGKWMLTTSAVAAGHYWAVVVIVIGTILSAAYLVRAIAPLLVESEDEGTAVEVPEWQLEHASVLTQLPPLVLGLLTIVAGFGGALLGDLLTVGAPW
ncbi:MAG: proton-conducting transporter membrane subunit [Nesterenkonia sp.]|uniref:complex I subunit 5 family protein n=1 Tax=Nesterenkonia marinintestina TaxID=2979865 RepID=UPI0021C1BBEA|nr:proton-conducting transporter membrane subunit [Nesterenkonia sp. GX14115]MDO5492829.1 proton-conducting transporter membrane subunit [Nesterenkonia sp.]